MKRRTCPSCGEGEIKELKRPGRRMPFRSIPDLEIPADIAIPTCDACGEEWLDAATSARLDASLKEAFSQALPSKVEQAITRLVDSGVTKQELERLLVLSGGYLSKVTAGKETSGQLAAALMLLAADPVSRIRELRDLWRTAPEIPGRLEIPCEQDALTFHCVTHVQAPPRVISSRKMQMSRRDDVKDLEGPPMKRAIG